MSEEEVNARPAREAAERRRKALDARRARSTSRSTTWPELPHPRRQRDHLRRRGAACIRYPDAARHRAARELARAPRRRARPDRRSATAPPSCSAAAARALLAPGDELSRRGPPTRCTRSWPAAPHGQRGAGRPARASTRCSRRRHEPTTRVDRALQPQRPHRRAAAAPRELRAPARGRCPSASRVLLDEALVDFVDAEPRRRVARRCSSAPAPARRSAASPRPGASPACASATRSAAPARRRCSTSSSPPSAWASWPRPARWRRCARPPATSSGAASGSSPRSARADRRAARPAASTSPPSQANFAVGQRARARAAQSWRRAWTHTACSSPPASALGEPHHVRVAHSRPAPRRPPAARARQRSLATRARRPRRALSR